MKLSAVLTAVVVAVLVLGGAFLIRSNGHYEESTRHVGPSGEAERNPLLACERMLTKLGLPTLSHRVVTTFPATDHVLVVVSDGSGIARTTRHGIVEWVKAGGHLVIVLPAPVSRKVLERLTKLPVLPALPFAADFEFEVSAFPERSDDVRELRFDADTVDVEFGDSQSLAAPRHNVTTYGEDGKSNKCISYAHGAGRVTVLASDAPLRNDAIGQHDHAEFAARIATLDPRSRAAWIVFGFDESLGFLRRLWFAAWPALSAMIALAVLWAWRAGRRFGPVIATPIDDRRDFADHVRASGSFLARQRAFATMIDAPRLALHAAIRRRRPDLVGRDDAVLHAELARIANVGVAEVHDALTERPSEREFVRKVRTLEHIRRSL